MSGICGVVRLDDKPVHPSEIGEMVIRLEQRGPDGTQVWTGGNVALGHACLATTPQAVSESLPLIHRATGCVITADARIDNREDIIERLDLQHANGIPGDGELILLAYLKWGADCPTHLLGDFAFAIWDPRDRTLFGARDLVGMRQLVYHHKPDGLFAFATEPNALRRHPDAPNVVNEARVADFLEDLEAHDLTSTFFEGVYRLPPAHALTLQKNDLRIWKHSELEKASTLKLAREEDYADAFLEVFTEAVRVRLRTAKPIASMLSGGMDSGSVSAVAASLLHKAGSPPLRTVSAMGIDPDCTETRTIKAALGINHIDPVLVQLSQMDEFRADLETHVRASAEPFDAHMTLVFAVYLAASKSGSNVVLDGVGGDTTLESGNMLAWHLRLGHFVQAWREAQGEELFYKSDSSPLKAYTRGIARMIAPGWLRKMRSNAYSRRIAQRAGADSLLAPEFAERIDIVRRRAANARHVARPKPDDNADRRSRVLHPYVVVARERYDRASGTLGIEPRDPFLDRRVIEFSLSLPPDQLQRHGWPKMILRRAMRGFLPDAVRWRTGKEHLGWSFTKSLWDSKLDDSIQAEIRDQNHEKRWVAEEIAHSISFEDYSIVDSLKLVYLLFWIDQL